MDQEKASKILYVSDLDGTLLDHRDTLPPYTIEVLCRMKEKGHVFSYATARSLITASKVTAGLKISLPVIVYNGAFIMDSVTGEVLSSRTFTKEEVVFARNAFREHQISPLVYSLVAGKECVFYLSDPGNQGLARYLHDRQDDPRMRPVKREEDLFQGDVFYFTCISDSLPPLEPLEKTVRENGRIRCTLQQELYREEYWCELMPLRATKADAVLRLRELLGCEKIVCFGDAINDLPMFRIADECYAVENAVPQLKEKATGILPSNEEEGVAHWLAKQVLGEEWISHFLRVLLENRELLGYNDSGKTQKEGSHVQNWDRRGAQTAAARKRIYCQGSGGIGGKIGKDCERLGNRPGTA